MNTQSRSARILHPGPHTDERVLGVGTKLNTMGTTESKEKKKVHVKTGRERLNLRKQAAIF